MRITEIKPRRKHLSALYLDGEFSACLNTGLLAEEGIRSGQEISEERLQDLMEKSDLRRAREKALYLLSFRDHSKKELMEKLRRTAGEEAAKEAAERMESLGLVNDEYYAEKLARELLFHKHYAAKRVVYELIQKGIEKERAEEITAELSPASEEQIAALLSGRYAFSLQDEKGKKRAVSGLQRLGFSWEEIRRALSHYAPEEGYEGD